MFFFYLLLVSLKIILVLWIFKEGLNLLEDNPFIRRFYLINDKKKRSSTVLFFYNIIGLSIGLIFITILIIDILDLSFGFGFFTSYLFFLILTTPFIIILNFCLAMLYLIFLIIFMPNLKISEFYIVILTFNTILFVNNTICSTLYLMNENNSSFILIVLLTLISSILSFLFLKSGLIHYVGFTKKVSLIFSIILLVLNLFLFLWGALIDVT